MMDIVGENIFEERKKGVDWLSAAVTGAKMIVPVTRCFDNHSSILTLLFVPVPGSLVDPLLLSVYSFFHWSNRSLFTCSSAHLGDKEPNVFEIIDIPRAKMAGLLERFTNGCFSIMLRFATIRYLTGNCDRCLVCPLG